MSILIRQARILSAKSSHHGKVMDILVDGGKISSIRKSMPLPASAKVIEAAGLCVSVGWFDLQAVSGEPGFEQRETLDSLVKAAASGGFTAIALHSHNQPALDNKAQIEFIRSNTRNKVVDVYPFGTITCAAAGRDISEMYDMQQAGALAFSDYKKAIQDAGTLLRALQYSSGIQSLLITHCQDESLSRGGQMNEGESSTALGLKGMPALAEELMLERNLSILEYAGGRLHIPLISSKGSVELIKKAKASGLQVTCGVSAAHLLLDDSALESFDTNYKINPPLRSKRDVQALRNALENGTIDVLVSDHCPLDTESKELEFDHADFGMAGVQTAFSVALEAMKEKNIEAIVRAFTEGPRQVLGIEEPSIEEGAEANLTLFSSEISSTLDARTNLSKSQNNPFLNQPLRGVVIGVINGSKSYFN